MSTNNAASAKNADDVAAHKQEADAEFTAAVDTRFFAIAESAGVITEGRVDKVILTRRVYEVLKTKHVVNIDHRRDDRRDPATSSSKSELASEIFPELPSASEADTNLVAGKVRDRCLSAIWNVTQTGDRGPVQKLLRADRLILIRGSVFRETSSGASLTVGDGVYVSTQEEVVLREFVAPRLEKLRKLTDALEDDYEMVKDRVPELAGPVRDAIEAALVEATAKLPVATLGSGASAKALGK